MHQNEEPRALDEQTLRKIDIIRDTLNKIINEMKAPMDPKAIAMLEMAVDMLEEQVILDKVYDYPDCPTCDADSHGKPNFDMMFFNNKKAPSAEDLEGMFDTSWMKDDDSS